MEEIYGEMTDIFHGGYTSEKHLKHDRRNTKGAAMPYCTVIKVGER